ncbi:XdhC family protein [Marinilongibacter aquaticus]|uniref:XdhC family protein n=1 Tax=Marinilongibacter aquaticus TaxID=2975157 RepID=UPI0021BDAF71|nr:XdhC family protein [Marinilongibacter aquaticus]UBM57428.1 XdhC family protein [Marinilongibacter aquaticus]
MKEIKKIVAAFQQKESNEKMALATVVRVEGSSYRRMGARMLVSERGNWVGGISGGCLEGDALKRARMAILKDKASVITYDTSIDDDHQIGVGLGCNGIIDVLFTPIDEKDPNNPIALFQKILSERRQTRRLLTISKSENSKELGKVFEFTAPSSLEAFDSIPDKNELAEALAQLQKSKNFHLSETLHIFAEVLPPSLHILLMGHQYDLYPLIDMIDQLGWDCTVVAQAEKVKSNKPLQIWPPEKLESLTVDNCTAVILMSHSLQTDKRNLKTVMQWPVPYIGLLGPLERSKRIFRELEEEGLAFSAEIQNRLFAPVGLNLGATSPEEIALSMVAEIKSIFAHRDARPLRERREPIHERDKPMKFY